MTWPNTQKKKMSEDQTIRGRKGEGGQRNHSSSQSGTKHCSSSHYKITGICLFHFQITLAWACDGLSCWLTVIMAFWIVDIIGFIRIQIPANLQKKHRARTFEKFSPTKWPTYMRRQQELKSTKWSSFQSFFFCLHLPPNLKVPVNNYLLHWQSVYLG